MTEELSPAENIAGIYSRPAQQWIKDRGVKVTYERGWLELFENFVQIGDSVLDLGCGSGRPLAAYFICAGYSLTGVDISPPLIAHCRAAYPHSGWLCADMRGLELGRCLNGILAWDSFFHLPPDDQRAMFAVFKRHAAAGAVLMFTSGPAFGEVYGEYCGELLYHASLDEAEYAALLEAYGFEVLAYRAEDPDCGGRTVWLARFIA